MAHNVEEGRQRGRIERRGDSLRVVVYAGTDPVTGRRAYLRETIKGTGKSAEREAGKALTRLLAQVDAQQAASSSVNLGYALDEWMRTTELEDSTREGYRGYIDRTIRPALGSVAIRKVGARELEKLYSELRRCRTRCDDRPFVEHKEYGANDCKKARCKPHKCKPRAAPTVRQIHAIISGAMTAAARWGWIDSNPARIAARPKQTPPEPDPPSPEEAARLVEEAFRMDEEWGTLV